MAPQLPTTHKILISVCIARQGEKIADYLFIQDFLTHHDGKFFKKASVVVNIKHALIKTEVILPHFPFAVNERQGLFLCKTYVKNYWTFACIYVTI